MRVTGGVGNGGVLGVTDARRSFWRVLSLRTCTPSGGARKAKRDTYVVRIGMLWRKTATTCCTRTRTARFTWCLPFLLPLGGGGRQNMLARCLR
jgi:hypothetical protein